MSTLAVLVPAYNAEAHIGQALDSVAAQSRGPDEIIVVDDGSSDQTAAVVSDWANRHPTQTLRLVCQPNGGASSARNTAICAAESDLIAFLDADDLYQPQHHERLAAVLETHEDVVAVFGQQSVFTENGETRANFLNGTPLEDVGYRKLPGGARMLTEGLWAALIQGNFIPTSGSMTRRRVVAEAGLFDTSLKTSEDRDLWLRVSRLGPLVYLPEKVARKREHETNLTSDSNRSLVNAHALDVVRKQLDRAVDLGLSQPEILATRVALERAERVMLYEASRRGLGAYLAARKHVANVSERPGQLDLKGWLRALGRSATGSHIGRKGR